MPNESENRVKHYQKKTNNVKKKSRTGAVILLSAVFVIVIAGIIFLGNHMEFTPDGVRFDFEDEKSEIEGITPVEAPVVDDEEASFSPKAEKQYSIARNELPNGDVPAVNGMYVDISGKTEAELGSIAVKLSEQGYSSAFIDIKSLDGLLSYKSESAMAGEKPEVNSDGAQLETFLKICSSVNIKVVGIIHCFADNCIPRSDSSLALCTESGALYIDGSYNTWLDPENEAVRQYIIDVAKETSALGLREIVLDDLCFPDTGNTSAMRKSISNRTELIMGMLTTIRENVDSTVRLGMVIYDDVAGEGFGESKGLDLETINLTCDHIYMHTQSLSEAIKYHGQLSNLSSGAGEKLCIELEGEYLSDGYYIERYKQEAYDNIEKDKQEEE